MRAVIAILALTMALPSAASARKVLNPSNTLSAALTSGSLSRVDPGTAASLDPGQASTTVDVPAGQGPPTPGGGAATIVKLPAARRCRASRTMRLRVLPSADAKVAAVRWSVGKRSKTTRGAKLNSPIVIRRLPRGAYTLKVVVTLANGNKLTEHRRYRTCPRTT